MTIIGDKFILNSYEYKILEHIPNNEELNELGSKGWEFCGILSYNIMNSNKVVFKRKNGELIGIAEEKENKI